MSYLNGSLNDSPLLPFFKRIYPHKRSDCDLIFVSSQHVVESGSSLCELDYSAGGTTVCSWGVFRQG